MELSKTSKTQWCRPRSSGSPMYMPGRFRTASKPSSLSIFEASYFSAASGLGTELSLSISSISLAIDEVDNPSERGVQIQPENCKPNPFKDNTNLGLFSPKNTISWGGKPKLAQAVGYLKN